MTVRNGRLTRRRQRRLAALVTALWLVTTATWLCVVGNALAATRDTTSLIATVATFDRYESYIVVGAVVGCALFGIRVMMYVVWHDPRR